MRKLLPLVFHFREPKIFKNEGHKDIYVFSLSVYIVQHFRSKTRFLVLAVFGTIPPKAKNICPIVGFVIIFTGEKVKLKMSELGTRFLIPLLKSESRA